MDCSDDEDFYDSDQSDVGEQSLHTMLKKTLYDKNNEYEEYGEQTAGEEEALGSVQEEVLGKVIDNGAQEEVILGPINNKIENAEKPENEIPSDAAIERKLDEADEVVLTSEVIGELEKKHFFDGLDDDSFEPLKKKQKITHEDQVENPHKTIVMHVPQFIRCNKGGQIIQVQ
jgi:transcription initiation factor TFIID TATA-box-binding protein